MYMKEITRVHFSKDAQATFWQDRACLCFEALDYVYKSPPQERGVQGGSAPLLSLILTTLCSVNIVCIQFYHYQFCSFYLTLHVHVDNARNWKKVQASRRMLDDVR